MKALTPKKSLTANKDTENRRIYKALLAASSPLTRRELSTASGLEIATLCRATFNLIHKSKTLVISHYGACKTTGKYVMHFALKTAGEGLKNEL